MRIIVKGLKQIQKKFGRMPKSIEDNADRLNLNIGRYIVRKVKRRNVPRFEGDLMKSVKIIHHTKKQVSVGSNLPYAKYQERGYTGHYLTLTGARIKNRSKLSRYYKQGNVPETAAIYVSNHTPFLKPAQDAAKRRMPSFMRLTAKQILREAGHN